MGVLLRQWFTIEQACDYIKAEIGLNDIHTRDLLPYIRSGSLILFFNVRSNGVKLHVDNIFQLNIRRIYNLSDTVDFDSETKTWKTVLYGFHYDDEENNDEPVKLNLKTEGGVFSLSTDSAYDVYRFFTKEASLLSDLSDIDYSTGETATYSLIIEFFYNKGYQFSGCEKISYPSDRIFPPITWRYLCKNQVREFEYNPRLINDSEFLEVDAMEDILLYGDIGFTLHELDRFIKAQTKSTPEPLTIENETNDLKERERNTYRKIIASLLHELKERGINESEYANVITINSATIGQPLSSSTVYGKLNEIKKL